MTFVLEGSNLVFFLICFGLALLVSMTEFTAPGATPLKTCPKHPGVPKCVCRGDDFGRRNKP